MTSTPINYAFMRLGRRAEGIDSAMLVETFVEAGPVFTLLRSTDHQILYGRRGTGKTHALQFLAQTVKDGGDAAVYVDMRTIGSNTSLYSSPSATVVERGSRLLADVLAFIHDELVTIALERADGQNSDLNRALRRLDDLAGAITEVRVEGDVEQTTRRAAVASAERTSGLQVGLSEHPSLEIRSGDTSSATTEVERSVSERGPRRVHVHFGEVSTLLGQLIEALPIGRLWLLIDEWSAIPSDLQPILADLLRRCVFPVRGVTVKLGAIEQLSRFRTVYPDGTYTGIEVGADAAADVDLDEFMVFGNDPARSSAFFKQLLYRHVRAVLAQEGRDGDIPRDADHFITQGFTQVNAFQELVRAAEGVPRDAINVGIQAAQNADDGPISVPIVVTAARTWYLRDKEASINSDAEARDLLHWIHDEVIGQRRARAFFLEQSQGDDPLVSSLYNARVLHVIKRGVASYLEPGVRFDVYAIDYGAYVHLRATERAVRGLFEVETDEGSVLAEVPADDYRSIRRAIVRLADFYARTAETAGTLWRPAELRGEGVQTDGGPETA